MAGDKTVLYRIKANVSDFNRGMMSMAATSKAASGQVKQNLQSLTKDIDKTNDRTAWLAQSVLGLGPAFVPLAAGAIPAVAGLATQMGVAALAAGTAALAFNGVGDGLKALNDYQLDPSVANLEKLNLALEKIGPAGEELVRFLDRVGPQFAELGMTGREEMFPGVQEGIESFLDLLPQLNRIVGEVAEGMGELASASGDALSGPRFEPFFNYLESDAKPILLDMGRTIGGFAEGLGNLFVAFGPLTARFSDGFADMARDFANWSTTLESNDSFQGFLEYVTEMGPKALDFVGQLVDSFAAIVRAAAPVGEVLLPAFTGLLRAVEILADSPLGPVFVALGAAVGLTGRALALASVTSGGFLASATRLTRANATAAFSFNQLGASATTAGKHVATAGAGVAAAGKHAARSNSVIGAQGKAMAGLAGQAALLGVVMTGTADKVGLNNTAMLALTGTLFGPVGTAVGATAGAFLDLRAAGESFGQTLNNLDLATRAGDISEIAKQIAAAKRELADVNKTDGVKDFFSDIGKSRGASLLGAIPGAKITNPDAENKIREAEATRGYILREQGANRAARAVASSSALAAQGYRLVGAAAGTAGQSIAQFTTSMNAATEALSRDAGIDAYKTSLLDAADALKENGKGLKGGTRDAIANRAALRGIASGAKTAAEGMKSFERRTLFLDRSRDAFIRNAVAMGATKAEARRLADAYGLVNRAAKNAIIGPRALNAEIRRLKSKIVKIEEKGGAGSRKRVLELRLQIEKLRGKNPKIDERGAAASAARVRALREQINALRDKEVEIRVRRRYSGNSGIGGADAGSYDTGADGGRVPKTGLPYADRHLYLLADGERIISNRNGQADRYDALLTAINSGKKIPGYADGGRTGSGARVSVAAPNVNVGGANLTVLLDGREIRYVVREELADYDDMAGMRNRA